MLKKFLIFFIIQNFLCKFLKFFSNFTLILNLIFLVNFNGLPKLNIDKYLLKLRLFIVS